MGLDGSIVLFTCIFALLSFITFLLYRKGNGWWGTLILLDLMVLALIVFIAITGPKMEREKKEFSSFASYLQPVINEKSFAITNDTPHIEGKVLMLEPRFFKDQGQGGKINTLYEFYRYSTNKDGTVSGPLENYRIIKKLQGLDDSFFAERPEDVAAIVWLKREDRVVGHYQGNEDDKAYRIHYYVRIANLKEKVFYNEEKEFIGGEPPKTKRVGAYGYGDDPMPQVVRYLKELLIK